ncbi:transcriptional repressor TCF25-domain-containing protein [Mucor mucedo]|uniref:transcriptional repressor TCF25-domain-containing protein n=1 Tax=Mucor mucedo TaxID=29922 RepID=UPI002220943B|nr:transcriptional repressor TCF25-domain-containing protein [Mucor mucedo]KAI7884726.1 transcriptional repressor TCF25-domain-containing protein [Mucor mucedo]
MSSRALRRLRKDQVPDIVNKAESEQEEEEEEEEEEYVQKKPFNPFDLLIGDDDQEEEEDEDEEEEIIPEPVVVKPVVEKKKNNNNKTSSPSKKKDTEDISMRELDKVLKEINKKTPKANKDNKDANTEERRQLLSVNYRFLDAEAEMKRLFGSHVVNSENRATQGRVLKKSKFASPKSDWAPYKRDGLSMESVETKDGITYYAFRHSEQYQDTQLEFLNAIATHNPEALLFLTRKHPYHVDSLLQLSEIAKQSGDWTAAGDFIERALYACERALHPQFSLSTGTARLSYKRSENRSFFLAIFRQIQFLTRRGCWKTASEFNKLLFSLDPVSDPLGALLSLDYHALSAKDYDYVVKMHKEWKTDGKLYPVDLANMPNFAYSAAYAKFKIAEKAKSTQEESGKMIQEAIKKYPLVYCRLLEKLGEPEVPQSHTLTQFIPNAYMDIMQLSYIERTHEMWKEPEVLEWLKINGDLCLDYTVSHPNVIQQKLLCEQKNEIPLSVCRYIVLIDIQKLMSYLPSSVTSQSYQMYDPLPPVDSETMYDINERMRTRGPGGAGIPDGLRNMLQGILGRNVPLPDMTREDIQRMISELERAREERRDQVPGAFPGAEDDYAGDYDDVQGDYPDLLQHEEEEEEEEEDNHELNHIENEMLQNSGMTAEEMMEIMHAVGDEDLEVQRALAEAFERNHHN